MSRRRLNRKDSNGESTRSPSFQRIRLSGSTIPRAPPRSGSNLADIIEKYGPTSAEGIHAFSSMKDECDDTVDHAYMNAETSLFHLRIGPNYKKTKTKAPSCNALCDLISCDFIHAETFLDNAKNAFNLPNIPGVTDVDTGLEYVPPMFVVNSWLPTKDHGAFSNGRIEKPSYIVVMVFAISEWVLEELKDIEKASPGVRLFAEWCRVSDTDPDFKGRFKAIGMVEDIESLGIPGFITKFNGKPALISKSGTFSRHENYIELSTNIHMWQYIARKGLVTLLPHFPRFVVNVGFTIEGRSDEDLPEVLLGGCRMIRIDPSKAVADGVHDDDGVGEGEEGSNDQRDSQKVKELNTEIGRLSMNGKQGSQKLAK
mmetsp:Transcript_17637/g.23538  ORF Transcript_17637/g.23538 Transcript_17637/m.23538 type:complete len:371 (-) Transcript_17637:351-1463(-)